MKESTRGWDLFDNSRQELLLQAFKRHGEVDDVGLDVHRRQEVGVRHRRRHVQPEIQGFITGGVSNSISCVYIIPQNSGYDFPFHLYFPEFVTLRTISSFHIH